MLPRIAFAAALAALLLASPAAAQIPLPIPTVALVQGGCFGGGTGVIASMMRWNTSSSEPTPSTTLSWPCCR